MCVIIFVRMCLFPRAHSKYFLAASLVTGMIDAFYGLIASLDFPWLFCIFLEIYFPLFLSLGNQRKTKKKKRRKVETNEKQKKSKDTTGTMR